MNKLDITNKYKKHWSEKNGKKVQRILSNLWPLWRGGRSLESVQPHSDPKQKPSYLKGNFFLHPINCDWHPTNILKPNCTCVMFILKKLVALMQMMPSNLRATMDDLRVPDFIFVQGVIPLNTMLPEKCQPRCEDANARARGDVGCKNGRNELGCVIGFENH